MAVLIDWRRWIDRLTRIGMVMGEQQHAGLFCCTPGHSNCVRLDQAALVREFYGAVWSFIFCRPLWSWSGTGVEGLRILPVEHACIAGIWILESAF